MNSKLAWTKNTFQLIQKFSNLCNCFSLPGGIGDTSNRTYEVATWCIIYVALMLRSNPDFLHKLFTTIHPESCIGAYELFFINFCYSAYFVIVEKFHCLSAFLGYEKWHYSLLPLKHACKQFAFTQKLFLRHLQHALLLLHLSMHFEGHLPNLWLSFCLAHLLAWHLTVLIYKQQNHVAGFFFTAKIFMHIYGKSDNVFLSAISWFLYTLQSNWSSKIRLSLFYF